MLNDFFIPFKGVYCKVQPIAFDGTLSFLELLGKIQDYLNQLNAALNEISTDQTEIVEQFQAALNALRAEIDSELEEKQNVLTFDSTPTANSENPVYSKGIKTYVDSGLAGKQNIITFDSTPTANSENPVYSKGIKTYVDSGLAGKQNVLTFDSTPTANSTNPVTSAGIKSYVDTAAQSGTTHNLIAQEVNRVLTVTDTNGNTIGVNTILVWMNRNEPVFITYTESGNAKTVFRMVGFDGTAVYGVNQYFRITGNSLGNPIWTIANRYDSTPVINGKNAVTSGGLFLAINPLTNATWANIEVDYDGSMYYSTETYQQILTRINDFTKAPPFVSIYDEDEGERTHVLYYIGKGGDDHLYFSNAVTTSTNAPNAPGLITAHIDRTNTWTVVVG